MVRDQLNSRGSRKRMSQSTGDRFNGVQNEKDGAR